MDDGWFLGAAVEILNNHDHESSCWTFKKAGVLRIEKL
jgi:hypothetical protein